MHAVAKKMQHNGVPKLLNLKAHLPYTPRYAHVFMLSSLCLSNTGFKGHVIVIGHEFCKIY